MSQPWEDFAPAKTETPPWEDFKPRPQARDLSVSDYAKALPSATKMIGKQALKTTQELGQGAISGATFDTMGKLSPEEEFMQKSIFNEQGKPKDFFDKYFTPRQVGQVFGGTIPLVLSEMMAGVEAPLLVTKYGLGAVKAAMAKAALMMANYEGMKGAVKGTPPLETTANMAIGAMGGGVLGAGEYGLGKLGEGLTKTVPEKIATEYLNTPATMAQSLRRKGKPSLAKQYLERTKYGAESSKNEVYNDISRELENNRMLIQNKLQQIDEIATTPNPTATKTEYMPERGLPFTGTREQIEIQKTFTRPQKPGVTIQEEVPQKYLPYTGIKERGALGEPIRPIVPTYPATPTYQTNPLISGGFERERYIPSESGSLRPDLTVPEPPTPITKTFRVNRTIPTTPDIPPPTLGGFEREVPLGSPGGTYRPGVLGEPTRVSPIQPGEGIDLDEIRSAQNPILSEQKSIGKPTEFIDIAPGEKIVSNSRAYQLLGELDAEVNNAYLKTPQNIPPGTEARAAMANYLRQALSKNAPEVSGVLNRNHFLQSIQTSLLPQVSESGSGRPIENLSSSFIRYLIGNRGMLGVARGLQSPITQEAAKQVQTPAAQGARYGLSQMIENVRNKGKK